MIYSIVASLFYIIFRLFFSLRIEGLENISRKGSYIIASNHSSFLDPPILGGAFYGARWIKLNFLAKEELFYNRAFGWLLLNLKAIPVKRQTGDIGAIKECIKRIKKGQPLAIFPEGERSPTGGLMPAFHGISLIATKTGVPVLPVFIKDADRAWGVGSKRIRFCKITLKIGKPIIFHHRHAPRAYPEITSSIMSAIKGLQDTNNHESHTNKHELNYK
jgi:1-acyl-sn-glycerol-3-phosphate acyltransferase